jgi:5-methylcytosine-specific restriction endonuclease McrA
VECFNTHRTGTPIARCRACQKAYYQEWRARPGVRDRQLRLNHEKYWADVEATRARSRAYRAANPEAVKRWKDAEYQRNGEEIRARMRAQYDRDREGWKAAVLAWARANPQMVNERNRRYRARKAKATIGIVTPALLEAKLAYWGNRCWMCGDDPDTWDHVKPLNKGGPHMLANLRPACWSCNSSKSDRWPFAVIPMKVG